MQKVNTLKKSLKKYQQYSNQTEIQRLQEVVRILQFIKIGLQHEIR